VLFFAPDLNIFFIQSLSSFASYVLMPSRVTLRNYYNVSIFYARQGTSESAY